MLRSIIAATVLILLLLTKPAAADPIGAYEGQRLFISYCMLCHGLDGKGDGPLARKMGIRPADLTVTIRSRSDTILKKIISGEGGQTITGRARHNLVTEAMPEWSSVFGDEQIDALIAYLRFLSTSKHELMGDPEAGHELYVKYCLACHGEEGYGDGAMTRLLKMEPADLSEPAAMNDLSNEELVASIVDGAGEYMPAWEGILNEDEVAALVSYIRLLAQ
jgi:mono/diheme cytochrome c family protein